MKLDLFEAAINRRLHELGVRIHEIGNELGHAMTQDLNDQAIDLEDDEVLEGLSAAAQKEVAALSQALRRIKNESYGICLACGDPISEERLRAVLYAPTCRDCAAGVEKIESDHER